MESVSLSGPLPAQRLSMIKTRKGRIRISQGDIFRDIPYIEYVAEESGVLEVSKIIFPLVIVLTQDCDLEQDYRCRQPSRRPPTQDKWLLSVLVAPLYNVEHVYLGEQLSEVDIAMETINRGRSPGHVLRTNQNPRYHYMEFPPGVPIIPSVIDFKHYFCVNAKYLSKVKGTSFVCSVSSLFREDICQRFSSFLSRIGLP